MTSIEKVNKIKVILESKKAVDVSVLRVQEESVIADYFIIATGTSSTHVSSLAQSVEHELKLDNILPTSYEGKLSNNWVLLDYGDVIVNVFSQEARDFYALEMLWNDKVAAK